MPDMMQKYKEEIRPALQAKLGCKNVMQIPKLEKIVLSSGMRSDCERDAFTEAQNLIGQITGQHAVITKARKNVANFKLRAGMNIGVMVTLRGHRMYEFLDRYVHNALPRVRDFRGISKKGFDIAVFAEIDQDKMKYPLGLNITMVTTAANDADAYELLKMLELPFAE